MPLNPDDVNKNYSTLLDNLEKGFKSVQTSMAEVSGGTNSEIIKLQHRVHELEITIKPITDMFSHAAINGGVVTRLTLLEAEYKDIHKEIDSIKKKQEDNKKWWLALVSAVIVVVLKAVFDIAILIQKE